ncbi:hypothetical protein FO519_005587 [Halicephalobus sp. NKZ332]|nr:hypothetical protein FO519_005587 [Halicephalobus sp. NKZ332]
MNYNNIPPQQGHPQQYTQMPPQNFHSNGFAPIKVDCSPSQGAQCYYQQVEMDVDYNQPRRAVSYGGPPPGFHCSPQIHVNQMPMRHMDHQMTGQNNFMDPQGNQMMPGPPQQIQNPFGYNGYQNLPPQQESQQQSSPMIRKMSSHGMQQQIQDNHQEVHFMHQTLNGYGSQPEPPQRTISTAGCGYENIAQREQSMAWRKMSLAPNIRMNSTYGSEFDSSPKQRSQSQAAEYAKRKASLRQFSSRLRVPKITGVANPMLSLTRYTPPPMLSPMRNGVGLFCKLSRKPSEFRKKSTIFDMATDVIMEEDLPSSSAVMAPQDSGILDDMDQGPSPCDQDDSSYPPPPPPEPQRSVNAPVVPIRPPIDNRANRPQRKIGLFLCGQETNSTGFAAELEALRKESAESSMSGKSMDGTTNSKYIQPRKCSTKASTSEDVTRKMSTVSMDEPISTRKISTLSEAYYDYTPCESDATPHINLGKAFQARVKKWSDREILPHEREAIIDRDEIVFDCNAMDHLDDQTVAAYEALACSAAFPKVGRNKELALHILMENKGNIQAAVMDLLRCDTLDWEQYPIIYNNLYNDVDNWTPEEIAAFQDAIYKSEKDFHQVANELGNRTVKECVSFYYMWKKACPDDYRKLRNLRRKRQLLEQQLDYPLVSNKQAIDEKQMEESSEEEIGSESESDMGTPGYVGNNQSPDECKPPKIARINSPGGINERKPSMVRFSDPELNKTEIATANAQSGPTLYPWLHGENGVFPSPSPTGPSNGNQSYSQPPSVGANDIFANTPFGPDILNQKIANIHRVTASKKGAQPSADGYFHCRLCDKRFEKVKSLNAHMKSHAMKARAEAEAQAQLQGSQASPKNQNQQEHARNLALLQQRQHQNGLLGNQGHMDPLSIQQQLNAVRNGGQNATNNQANASPLNLGHLSRMTQFASPIGIGGSPLNPAMGMFTPDMLSAMQTLASLPNSQHNLSTSVATTAALQQLHNNLHSATIIN